MEKNIVKVSQIRNVISAMITYSNLKFITIAEIARSLGVSQNTLTNWFAEAISKRYIESDEICTQVIQKHIHEYEKQNGIKKSNLRILYYDAMITRKSVPEVDPQAFIACNYTTM